MSVYDAVVEPAPGGALLRVHLVPRASAAGVGGVHGDALKVRVPAPPLEGKANAALLATLADLLGVRARDLQLVSGARSRSKVVAVNGMSPAAVAAAVARVSGGRR